jgi:hypothetical protein
MVVSTVVGELDVRHTPRRGQAEKPAHATKISTASTHNQPPCADNLTTGSPPALSHKGGQRKGWVVPPGHDIRSAAITCSNENVDVAMVIVSENCQSVQIIPCCRGLRRSEQSLLSVSKRSPVVTTNLRPCQNDATPLLKVRPGRWVSVIVGGPAPERDSTHIRFSRQMLTIPVGTAPVASPISLYGSHLLPTSGAHMSAHDNFQRSTPPKLYP